ncbi:MAG: excinuclease ABC subunit UvrB [Bacteroidales bacterium]
MNFELISEFKPTGDQPEAIQQLTEGILRGDPAQVLLGVTGSGKTFTIANAIEKVQRPTLVLSHNKTLAAQLYGEFKQFFPNNAVEYFVSYYDYYQPEAYIPVTNTYIEKDLSINEEIEKLRLSATSSLLSGRRDVIVVSSVSCIYGIGNPDEFNKNTVYLRAGDVIPRNKLLQQLVTSLYSRAEAEFSRGTFRVSGDTVEVFPAYSDDYAYRLLFWDDELEAVEAFIPETGKVIEKLEEAIIYPANIFVTSQERMNHALTQIQLDLGEQLSHMKENGKHYEAQRLNDRVTYDVEMMRELGYCSGIENYSRYFDGREPGTRPFCLLDYFPDDYLTVIDESHVTIPQLHAMYGGDRSRKENLVEYGFRLPAALDNRPLKFDEFMELNKQIIYVSATPGDYELQQAGGVVTEQLVRPTGLLDPPVTIKPTMNQIDDLLEEVRQVITRKERVLVTTLTKRMAEELTKYLLEINVKTRYIHSDVDTLERVEILRGLRSGTFDVLVGVNLLREGLDLPEVSLVAIMDADKEGFLRSETSLTQTAGRAARNINAKVIMYADKITGSMKRTIEETERRREKQLQFNLKHNITPTSMKKTESSIRGQTAVLDINGEKVKAYAGPDKESMAADPVVEYMSRDQLEKALKKTAKKMESAVKELNFLEAAQYRDEMMEMEKRLKNMNKKLPDNM